MLKRNLFLRFPDRRVGGSPSPSKRTGPFSSINTPSCVAGTQASLGRTVVSLLVAALVFVAAVVVQSAGLAQAPASADAAANPMTAYVTNTNSNTVTPIDVATNTPGSPIPVGTNPRGIAVTPDGKIAYVTNQGSGTVTPINVATNAPGSPIFVGNTPSGVAVTPDDKTAYVTNNGSNTVTPIDVATNTPGTPIPIDIPIRTHSSTGSRQKSASVVSATCWR